MNPQFPPTQSSCPDCPPFSKVSRRDFLSRTAVAVTAAAAGTFGAQAIPSGETPQSETLVSTFHKSLTQQQRDLICMPFEHERRLKVDNNWFVTKARLGKDFTKDQQQMVREIFLGLHHPNYAERVLKATEHDSGDGGFGELSVALFGEPGSGKYEFVISGRHVTRRCDGDSVDGAAFGGPIFYGHAPLSDDETADHPQNIYWYQARRANEVFKALDGKQRNLALLEKGRPEKGTDTVKLTGQKTGLPGIPMSELSRDQKELVQKVIGDLMAPFRSKDTKEAMAMIQAAGMENLHMAFFKNGDIGNDGVWDVWQVEGPSMVCYFRGSPHVHTWLHVRSNPVQA